MRVGAEIEIQACPAPESDSFHSAVQGVFRDRALKASVVLALPAVNCVTVSRALLSYVVKEGLGDDSSPDLIVTCSIFRVTL